MAIAVSGICYHTEVEQVLCYRVYFVLVLVSDMCGFSFLRKRLSFDFVLIVDMVKAKSSSHFDSVNAIRPVGYNRASSSLFYFPKFHFLFFFSSLLHILTIADSF